MDEEIETLLVDVRASTSGFKADMDGIRSSIDTTLVDGFARAGNALERGLTSAIRRGNLGFDDLRRVAMSTLDQIAAQAVQMGLDRIFSGGSGSGGSGGKGNFLSNLFAAVVQASMDAPGRATGGPVSPGTPYLVGERGPEMFVPTSAGRVEPGLGGARQDVRIAINLAAPRGQDAPVALRRSSRQLASSVRRALNGS